MALPDIELKALKARCQQALATGFGLGKADAYQAELAAELGQKPSGKATTAAVLDLLEQVEAARAGKPLNATPAKSPPLAKSPPPVEEEDEEDGEDEDADEDAEEDSSPSAAPLPTKPKARPKKKATKKR